ncbi:MAG: hypothetical protein RI947_644 [Candidatus Parcubacteria bacterium]|jgi:hypothetical protein
MILVIQGRKCSKESPSGALERPILEFDMSELFQRNDETFFIKLLQHLICDLRYTSSMYDQTAMVKAMIIFGTAFYLFAWVVCTGMVYLMLSITIFFMAKTNKVYTMSRKKKVLFSILLGIILPLLHLYTKLSY